MLSYIDAFQEKLRNGSLSAVLIKAVGGLFSINILSLMISFVLSILLVRIMGTTSYGRYAFAFEWMSVLTLFASFGLGAAALRFVSAYNATKQWSLLRGMIIRNLQSVLATSILLALLASAFIWFQRESMVSEQVHAFWVAFALAPLIVINEQFAAILKSLKWPVISALPDYIVRPLLFMVLIVIAYFVLGGLSAPQALAMYLVATVVAFFLAVFWLRQAIPPEAKFAKADYRSLEWLQVSLPMWLNSNIHLILKRADIIMVGIFLGPEAVALYAIAVRLSDLASLGQVSMSSVIAPMISEHFSTRRMAELQHLLRLSAWGIFGITLLIVLGLGLLGETILGIYGPEFTAVFYVLLVLMLAHVLNALAGPVGWLMSMTGHQLPEMWLGAAFALLNIVLNLSLIPTFGLMGAASATAIATAGMNLMKLVYVGQKLKLNPTIFSGLPRR